jgi:hypothetical protein
VRDERRQGCRRAIKLLREIMKNLKLVLLALVATLGLAVITTLPAQAAQAGCTTMGPCGGGGGGGDTSDGGEPFDPFCHVVECDEEPEVAEEGCMKNCDGPDVPEIAEEGCMKNCQPGKPGDDPKIPGNVAGLVRCDAKIGDLAKVTARQIGSVNGRDAVDVVPVCADKNLVEQQLGVESLRNAIARNDKMDKALGQGGYAADDVVGVIVGRNSAVLYVHAL